MQPEIVTFPPGTRWARASNRDGHFCRHESHAPYDYDQGPRYREVGGKQVELSGRACGICYPRTVWITEQATTEDGDVPF